MQDTHTRMQHKETRSPHPTCVIGPCSGDPLACLFDPSSSTTRHHHSESAWDGRLSLSLLGPSALPPCFCSDPLLCCWCLSLDSLDCLGCLECPECPYPGGRFDLCCCSYPSSDRRRLCLCPSGPGPSERKRRKKRTRRRNQSCGGCFCNPTCSLILRMTRAWWS